MDLRRLIPAGIVTVVLGISLSPIAAAQRADQLVTPTDRGSSSPAESAVTQYIAVRTRGDAKDENNDPFGARHRFTFPLYSMVDGSLVGNATDDVACSSTTAPPCAVVDAITTFRFTRGPWGIGTIVNEGQVSIAPDPQKPGFIINGERGAGNTIRSATGDFAGHTATVSISGGNDVHNFPMELIQDDFWLIELH
jgi:hypothetical protein